MLSHLRWFSLEITRDEWPWVFEKSSKPALIISTLEALAVLVASKVYNGEEPRTNRSSIRIVPTTTDNRGNGAALNKLMTTRYPASAVLMELAAYSKKVGSKASVEWSPREANREADALANGELVSLSAIGSLSGLCAGPRIRERSGGSPSSSEGHRIANEEPEEKAQTA